MFLQNTRKRLPISPGKDDHFEKNNKKLEGKRELHSHNAVRVYRRSGMFLFFLIATILYIIKMTLHASFLDVSSSVSSTTSKLFLDDTSTVKQVTYSRHDYSMQRHDGTPPCVARLQQQEGAILLNSSSLADESIQFSMLLFPPTIDKIITPRILKKGVYEPDMEGFIAKALPQQEGGKFDERPWAIDVGANVGFHSLHMASRGANVLSFEPAPDTADLFRCSSELLFSSSDKKIARGSITVIQAGASDEIATGLMSRHPNSPGMTTFGTNSSFPLQALSEKSDSTITLVRLQDMLERYGVLPEEERSSSSHRLRLLKVDTEGYELRTLGGLNLTRFPFQFLTFEFFPRMLKDVGDNPVDLLLLVRNLGYKCEHDKDAGITRDTIQKYVDKIGDSSHVNVFCQLLK